MHREGSKLGTNGTSNKEVSLDTDFSMKGNKASIADLYGSEVILHEEKWLEDELLAIPRGPYKAGKKQIHASQAWIHFDKKRTLLVGVPQVVSRVSNHADSGCPRQVLGAQIRQTTKAATHAWGEPFIVDFVVIKDSTVSTSHCVARLGVKLGCLVLQ